MTAQNIFKYIKTSPEIIRLAVMYYVRYPLSFLQVEDILHERPFRAFAKQNPTGIGN
jgi:putative transposase